MGRLRLCEPRLDVSADPRPLLLGYDARPCSRLDRTGSPRPGEEDLDRLGRHRGPSSTRPARRSRSTRERCCSKPSLTLPKRQLSPPLTFAGKQPLVVDGKEFRGKIEISQRRQATRGRRRRRSRGLPEGRRAVGDAREVAGRGAPGPGGRRPLLRTRKSGAPAGLRPLLRHAQPGVRRCRRRVACGRRRDRRDQGRGRALAQQGGRHALLLDLRRPDRVGRGGTGYGSAVPRLGPGSLRHGLAGTTTGARSSSTGRRSRSS